MADAQIQQGNQAATNLSGTPVSQLGVTGDSSIPTTATQNSTSPNVMTPTQAFNNNPIPVPTVQSPSNTSSIVAGAQQTVDQVTQSLTPAPTALDNQQQGLLNDISSLTGEDSGKDQALLNEQNANGATADQTALTSANNELNTKIASYNQLEANVGSGIGGLQASAAYNAQLAGLKTAAAADIGVTQAKITAAQGNLTLALSQAQSAIDARYSTIEDNIKTKQAQLAAIAPQLSAQQKTQALAQQTLLQQQSQQVQDAKDKETQINNVALQAASAGATPDILAAIQNAPDIISAIAAAAPALGVAATAKAQQQQFDNNITLQQLAISKAQEAISAETANANIQEKLNESSPAALLQYAQQYQATGVMPQTAITDGLSGAVNAIATGQGTKDGQAAIPLATGTIINSSTNVADPKLQPEQEQSINSALNIVQNILPELSKEFGVNTSVSPTNVSGQATSDQLSGYQNTVVSLQAALTSLSNAGILKGTAADFQKLIPNDVWGLNTNAGNAQLTALGQDISEQLNEYLSTNNLSIVGFSSGTLPSSSPDSASNLSQFNK